MSIGTGIGKAISFVERMGQDIMHELQNGAVVLQKVQPVANFVGNIIGTIEPGLAPAVKLVLGSATYVEGAFAAAGNATGSGAHKLDVVTTMTGDTVAYFLNQAGKASDAASVQDFISKIVNIGKNDANIWAELQLALGQSAPITSATTAASAAAASVAHA